MQVIPIYGRGGNEDPRSKCKGDAAEEAVVPQRPAGQRPTPVVRNPLLQPAVNVGGGQQGGLGIIPTLFGLQDRNGEAWLGGWAGGWVVAGGGAAPVGCCLRQGGRSPLQSCPCRTPFLLAGAAALLHTAAHVSQDHARTHLNPTPREILAGVNGGYAEPLTPEQQHQAFLSRLLLMLGSFVIMVR